MKFLGSSVLIPYDVLLCLDYAVVSDPAELSLFVLVRDPVDFKIRYEEKVLNDLKSLGTDDCRDLVFIILILNHLHPLGFTKLWDKPRVRMNRFTYSVQSKLIRTPLIVYAAGCWMPVCTPTPRLRAWPIRPFLQGLKCFCCLISQSNPCFLGVYSMT